MLSSGTLRNVGLFVVTVAVVVSAGTTPRDVHSKSQPPVLAHRVPADRIVIGLASRLSPGKRIVSAAAVDVDHDGDLDVIAATSDNEFRLWLNDGGTFTRQRPASRPGLADADGALSMAATMSPLGIVTRSRVAMRGLSTSAIDVPRGPPLLVRPDDRPIVSHHPALLFGRAPPPIHFAA